MSQGEWYRAETIERQMAAEATERANNQISRAHARIAALEAENARLRGWQAGQTHYVGCWREHRSCALATIDFEGARRERAELALREAVEELNRLRDGRES